jgi:hypothetical protein
MALIRSTSLTRSYVRISLRGICVLSVNEVAETWKVPSEAAKWLRKVRKRGGWVITQPRSEADVGYFSRIRLFLARLRRKVLEFKCALKDRRRVPVALIQLEQLRRERT